jgi:hypothetical protein
LARPSGQLFSKPYGFQTGAFDPSFSNPSSSSSHEDVHAVQENVWSNPYSNSYNFGWKNHPNFSWKDHGQQTQYRPNNYVLQKPMGQGHVYTQFPPNQVNQSMWNAQQPAKQADLNLNMVEMQGSMLQLIQQMNTLPDTLQS